MGLWNRLFGRKPEAPKDLRHHGEEFCVGDLAECISDNWANPRPNNPVKGDVLRVSGIVDEVSERLNARLIGLLFESKPQNEWWSRAAFRKLVQQHEPAEEEFTALIKRPVRKRVRA